MMRCTAWVLLCLPFVGVVAAEDCVSESCDVPPVEASEAVGDAFASPLGDAFASLQLQHEAADPEVTYIIYKNGTFELYVEPTTTTTTTEEMPGPPPSLVEGKVHEGFPWKIWKKIKIKQAIDRARRARLRGCHPGDFAFTFQNAGVNGRILGLNSTDGIVTGCISGLHCPQVAGQPSSVRVVTNEDGFGIGEFLQDNVTNVPFNNFTVDAHCNMVSFEFTSFGPPALPENSLALLDLPDPRGCAGISQSPDFVIALCRNEQPAFHYISH